MKLATYNDGSRDGQLVVVSRDLTSAHYATGIATRLQQVLDDWNFLAPQLEALSLQLQQGRARHAFDFDPQRCMAPLPRGFAWFDYGLPGQTLAGADDVGEPAAPTDGETDDEADAGTAVPAASSEPLRRGRARTAWRLARMLGLRPGDATLPPQGFVDPGASGRALRPAQGLAAITGDVSRGVLARDAIDSVRLLMWVQNWASEADPSLSLGVACSPVVLTPDELGPAWHAGVLRGQPRCALDGRWLDAAAKPSRRSAKTESPAAERAATELPRWPQGAHVGDLIAVAARTRGLQSGSVVAWYAPVDGLDPAIPAAVGWGHSLRVDPPQAADGLVWFGSLQHSVGRPSDPEPQELGTAGIAAANPAADPATEADAILPE